MCPSPGEPPLSLEGCTLHSEQVPSWSMQLMMLFLYSHSSPQLTLGTSQSHTLKAPGQSGFPAERGPSLVGHFSWCTSYGFSSSILWLLPCAPPLDLFGPLPVPQASKSCSAAFVIRSGAKTTCHISHSLSICPSRTSLPDQQSSNSKTHSENSSLASFSAHL